MTDSHFSFLNPTRSIAMVMSRSLWRSLTQKLVNPMCLQCERESASNDGEAIWLIHEADASAVHDEIKLFIQMFGFRSHPKVSSRRILLIENFDDDKCWQRCCLLPFRLLFFLFLVVISLHLPLRALMLAYGLVSSYVLWIQINLYFAFLCLLYLVFLLPTFDDARLSAEIFLFFLRSLYLLLHLLSSSIEFSALKFHVLFAQIIS